MFAGWSTLCARSLRAPVRARGPNPAAPAHGAALTGVGTGTAPAPSTRGPQRVFHKGGRHIAAQAPSYG
ncbi:hypothetical protein GCM10010442_77830 [Kitasatospora kifunensis]